MLFMFDLSSMSLTPRKYNTDTRFSGYLRSGITQIIRENCIEPISGLTSTCHARQNESVNAGQHEKIINHAFLPVVTELSRKSCPRVKR